MGEGVKARVDLILRNGALVANEALQLADLVVVLCLEAVDVLLRDLHVRLQLQDVDEELALVCEFLLVIVDELGRTGFGQFRQHVEEHGVTVGLLHDLGHLSVKVIDQVSGRMVDNLVEALEADTALADVTIEEANANDDVRELAQLGHLLGGRKGNEWT